MTRSPIFAYALWAPVRIRVGILQIGRVFAEQSRGLVRVQRLPGFLITLEPASDLVVGHALMISRRSDAGQEQQGNTEKALIGRSAGS